MFITSPITNDASFQIINYAKDKYTTIKIFIDIQNISTGKYYHEIAEQAYLQNDEKTVISQIYSELCYLLSNKLYQFQKNGFNNTQLFLYSDSKRNVLNEYFINTWKKNRKKEWINLFEKDKVKYESVSWLGKVYDIAIGSFRHLINTSPRSKMILLQYLDSDFVPKLFMMLDRYLGTYENTLYVIVANDYDYVHLLDENDNTIIYVHTDRQLNIINKYNLYKRLYKRYKQKAFQESDRKLIGKYYCLFHSLIGDSSDGFGPIVKGKSIVYWYKRIKDIISKYSGMYELRPLLWNNILELEDNVYEEFIKRIQIVDFYYFSIWILGSIAKQYKSFQLDEYDQNLYNLTYAKLPLHCRNIISQNVEILVSLLSEDNIITPDEGLKVLKKFNVANAEQYCYTLWS